MSSPSAALVLITTNHPFVHTGGEVMFVGPELKRLARELSQVRVVPLHATEARVEVPEGVEVDTSLSDAMQRDRFTAYLRALWWPGFWAELMRAVRHGGWTGCARVWRWAATAQTTYRWARSAFPSGSAALFYTYWRGGSTVALARLADEQAAMKVVTRVHRYELYEDAFDPPFQPWHPSLYQSLALTATVSQDGYDYLRGAGVPAERLMLSRLGTEASPSLARASTDGVLRIVSASFVTPVKRVPLIAQTVMDFSARHRQQAVEWTHFGDGPQLDSVRQLLLNAPTNLRASLLGHVANAAVMAHYASQPVDVFLLLSESEGLPVSVQEAASVGLPIIATNVGGVRELVGGDNGVLLEAAASQADVVAALEQVLLNTDAGARQAMQAASHRRWTEGFDAEINHTRFSATLKRLLDSLRLDGRRAQRTCQPHGRMGRTRARLHTEVPQHAERVGSVESRHVNILLINHYAGSPQHGMEYRPYYLAREWVRAGHSVQIVAASYSHVRSVQPVVADAPLDEVIDGIHYRWVLTPAYLGNGVGRVLNIWSFLRRVWADAQRLSDTFQPDVVIASSTYPMDIWVARRVAKFAHAKLVYEVHDLWPASPMELSGMSRYHPFIMLCQKAENDAYRDADVVVSMLSKVADHMAVHGLDLRKLHIVPNGISPEEWGTEVAATEPEPLRADVHAHLEALRAAGHTIVGYAGSHGLPNALDVLLDAAVLLRNEKLSFVCVGGGLEKVRLAQRVADEGLRHVSLFDAIPKAQIPSLLREFDVAYIGWQRTPLYRFGIAPNKLMDYMMASRVVLHSVEAGNDPVAEAGCGLTVAPESAQAVAEGLRALMRIPPETRAEMGRRGRDFVIAHHTYPVLAQRFIDAVSDRKALT